MIHINSHYYANQFVHQEYPIIPTIEKFSSLLSAKRSQAIRRGIKNARFRNDYFHSWRIRAPGRFQEDEGGAHPGKPINVVESKSLYNGTI